MIRAAWFGLALGVIGAALWILPPVSQAEREFGLAWLFRLRGPLPEPATTAVIAMDRSAARALGYGEKPSEWSRTVHADLIRKLHRAGAAAVVFDVAFVAAHNDAADASLAAAVAEADNVIVAEALRREWIDGASGDKVRISQETLLEPLPAVAQGALDMAPFPLPKELPTIDYWQWYRSTAGDVATLPAVALAACVRPYYAALSAAWVQEGGRPLPEWRRGSRVLQRLLAELREGLRAAPGRADKLTQRLGRETAVDARGQFLLQALIALASSEPEHLIDHYGPPRTVKTVSYHRAVRDDDGAASLAGRVVFVGYSADAQSGQDIVRDNYPTVYPGADGLEQSGVEIAATAFANLLEPRRLHACDPMVAVLLLVGWGFLCGIGLGAGRPLPVLSIAVVLAVGWIVLALALFSRAHLWIPLLVPEIQLAAAAAAGLAMRYEVIRRAIGYFVPARVVERMSRAAGRPEIGRVHTHGVILLSDAEQYTAVTERVTPDRLRAVLQVYQRMLAAAVESNGGSVVDWAGDGMLAIWEEPNPQAVTAHAEAACRAALRIVAAAAVSLEGTEGIRLPTRVGIHGGPLLMDLVGGGERYAYRPVGDVVNTAARLQELNKTIGSHLLVTAEYAAHLPGFVVRPLGEFELRGKAEPVDVCEVLGEGASRTPLQDKLLSEFSLALLDIRGESLEAALWRLEKLAVEFPDDGPTRFYLAHCRKRHAQPG